MKHLAFLMICMLLNSFISPLFAQQDPFINDYVERLEHSQKYVILLAETMPKDKYHYKATPESISFAENLTSNRIVRWIVMPRYVLFQ
jgi:hypothetical protein